MESLEETINDMRQSSPIVRNLLTCVTVLGLLVVVYYLIKLLIKFINFLRIYVVYQINSRLCSRINLRRKYGKWAVVTGATDGIGAEFARQLAEQGMSLIIIARNDEKLARTKASLEKIANVGEVVTIKKDFSDSSLESYEKLRKKLDLENREIGVLVNNVGYYFLEWMRFCRAEKSELKAMVDVNILSMVMMTRAILPSMAERGNGLVVNVSSMFGAHAGPYIGVYSPTKAFVDSFSKQLQFEYRNHGPKIVNLTTGPVCVDKIRRIGGISVDFSLVSTEDYVSSVLNILTKSWHPFEFDGCLIHFFMAKFMNATTSLGLTGYFTEWRFLRADQLSPVPKRKNKALEGAAPTLVS